VARPPVGKGRQDATSTALFGFVAARLNAIGQGRFDAFFRDELELELGENGARKAGVVAQKRAREEGQRAPFQKWMLVDEHVLGLEKVVLHVPGQSPGQGELRARLLGLPEIRQVVEAEVSGDLYAVAVVRNGDERRALRAKLDELSAERPVMEPVAFETHEPARRLWRCLAKRAALDDGLVLKPDQAAGADGPE
jgi:hypothetical protein